jgi:hypothetical protein
MGYDIGTFMEPGPGLFPLALGILITVLSFILLVQTRKSSSPAEEESLSPPKGPKRVAYCVLVLLLAAFGLFFVWNYLPLGG